jgi:hypothetical protein
VSGRSAQRARVARGPRLRRLRGPERMVEAGPKDFSKIVTTRRINGSASTSRLVAAAAGPGC